MVEYKKMPKAQKLTVYRLRKERDVSSRSSAETGTPKDYFDLKRQVSALSKKMNDFLSTYEPSSDEDGNNNKKVKFGRNKSNSALGLQ